MGWGGVGDGVRGVSLVLSGTTEFITVPQHCRCHKSGHPPLFWNTFTMLFLKLEIRVVLPEVICT